MLSAIALVFALLSLLLFCAGAMSVPTFTKVFEDFDTELPGMTLLFLSMPPLGFVAIGLLGVPLLLKEWFVPSALVKLAINVLVVCFASLAFGAMVLALFLPLVSLMAEISATP